MPGVPGMYHLVLRAVPAAAQQAVAGLLARAFSLKDANCTAIAASAPILLLNDLDEAEVIATCFALSPLERAGATIDAITQVPEEIGRIDWPRRPQIFRRDMGELVADLETVVAIGETRLSLRELIGPQLRALGGRIAPSPATTRLANSARAQFNGIQLPEITPFSTPVLPPGPSGAPADDGLSRLNELFPDDSALTAPSKDDISSLLDKILPDEAPAAAPAAVPTPSTPLHAQRLGQTATANSMSPVGQGWSLFLPKFADDARRQKAVPLIAEHGRMTPEDADSLSRKMIIPVIKGGTQAEAESARQAFAKIGVVAKIKAPGT